MGWVPPPAPPVEDVEGRARHRARLIAALGYDPAVEKPKRGQLFRFILRSLRP